MNITTITDASIAHTSAAAWPSKLAAAKALAAEGRRVFPLRDNDKRPRIKGCLDKATTDLATIVRWWTLWPDANIGVATGRGLVVLDVDDKNGKNGSLSLEQLDFLHDLPPTYTVTTASGGRHLYYDFPEDKLARNSRSVLADGLDTLGDGGFVVAPGSTLNGVEYRVTNDAPLAQCPLFLRDFCIRRGDGAGHSRPVAGAVTPGVDLDDPQAVARGIKYLTEEAEPAVEGVAGDHYTTNVVAKRLGDLGLSEETAFELMLDHWNDRCSPPWQPDELATKVHNGFTYGREKPLGYASPAADFEPVTLDAIAAGPVAVAPTDAAQAPKGLPLEFAADIAPLADVAFLVDDYIACRSLGLMYGKSGAGKSFVAIDLAFSVATGRKWLGQDTEQGAVLYVAAEGGTGIRKRLAALKKHFGVADFPLAVVPAPITLTHKKDWAALVDVTAKAKERLRQPIALIILDTLSNVMEGDENASADMRALIAAAKGLIAATGATVLFIHHSGKDRSKNARGHSSLRAAVDTEMEVEADCLTVTKQRDADGLGSRGFRRLTVDLGHTAKGKVITSCVVEWADAATDFAPVALSPHNEVAFKVLKELAAAAGSAAVPGGVTEAEWRRTFVSSCSALTKAAKGSAFRYAKKTLLHLKKYEIRNGLIHISRSTSP